jgi:hypothetical protein
VIDRNGRLVHHRDDGVSAGLHPLFQDEGIHVVLNARIQRASGKSGEHVRVVLEQGGIEKTIEGTHLLAASGRAPNTEGIGLELAGVASREFTQASRNVTLHLYYDAGWASHCHHGSMQWCCTAFEERLLETESNGIRIRYSYHVPPDGKFFVLCYRAEGGIDIEDPIQIHFCPWCGSELSLFPK